MYAPAGRNFLLYTVHITCNAQGIEKQQVVPAAITKEGSYAAPRLSGHKGMPNGLA